MFDTVEMITSESRLSELVKGERSLILLCYNKMFVSDAGLSYEKKAIVGLMDKLPSVMCVKVEFGGGVNIPSLSSNNSIDRFQSGIYGLKHISGGKEYSIKKLCGGNNIMNGVDAFTMSRNFQNWSEV